MGRSISAAAIVMTLAGVISCFGLGEGEPTAVVDLPAEPTWVDGVDELLSIYCGECHGPQPIDGSIGYFRVDTYENTGGRLGAFALRDRHLARAADSSRPMPPPPARAMTPSEVQALRRWVNAGAPYDSTSDGAGTGLSCSSGEVAACACRGGYYGSQLCLENGTYEVCDCGEGDGPGPGGEPPAEPRLADVVAWVLDPSCNRATSCHSTTGAPPGLVDDGALRNRLLEHSTQAPSYRFIEPGFPDQSYLYLKTLADFRSLGIGEGDRMPNTTVLLATQAGVLERWIASGAPE